MSTITSRPAEPAIRPSRNFLYEAEQKVVDDYRKLVAGELMLWISDSDKALIKVTPKDGVISLHHSLGMAVRNEYELWMPEHDVTEIYHRCEAQFPLVDEQPNSDGLLFDEHPCHPDNFSMSCIELLWENLQ